MAFRLPRLQRTVAVADESGLPTSAFQRWWQSFVEALETQEALQDATIAQLLAVQLDILAIQDAQQDQLDAIQQAQAAAVAAQNAADQAAQAAATATQAAADANTAIVTVNTTLGDYNTRITNLEGSQTP